MVEVGENHITLERFRKVSTSGPEVGFAFAETNKAKIKNMIVVQAAKRAGGTVYRKFPAKLPRRRWLWLHPKTQATFPGQIFQIA